MSDLSNDALAWIAERPGVASDERITEIATELLALRAHAVGGTDGPDQGDPAAWAWLNPDGVPCGFTTAKVQADAWRENGGVTRNVVALDVRAAPGAVAAAPPGDEDADRTRGLLRSAWLESEDWRHQAERLARLLVRDRVALARVKAERDRLGNWLLDAQEERGMAEAEAADNRAEVERLTRLAPPAGHEDEAAVERMARALYDQDYGSGSYEAREGPGLHESHRTRARTLLAAARGPRPVEDEAAVERVQHEGDATDDLRAVLNALYSDGEREAAAPARARFMRHLATGGAVRLVPPAGQEDEATVERAVRDAAFDVLCETDGLRTTAGVSAHELAKRIAARAALAAARGPRTYDGPVTN